MSGGRIQGIAPGVFLVGVRVLDSQGRGKLSAMLEGIRWIRQNSKRLDIRIVNISVGSVKRQQENSMLIHAVDQLWDSGIIVCTAAGNEGSTERNITAPGISRKVITVGSYDDEAMIDEEGVAHHHYSGRGPTVECICKPELVAPGTNILSVNAMNSKNAKPYAMKSGTSMSTPMVSGAVALLIERYPHMDNKNIKLTLWKHARSLELEQNHQGWGMVDIEALLRG